MPFNAYQADKKIQIRRHMQTTRRALTLEERQTKSYTIAANIIRFAHYIDSPFIAAYYPNGTEVDCRPILTHALSEHKKVYLPVVPYGAHKTLWFCPYLSHDPAILKKNNLGIPAPPFNPDTALTAKDLNLVFVPLLAFDTAGYRLGTGGGYYDISFQWLKEARLKKEANCILVGLAFDCQEFPQLPVDAWDIPLDYIITESRTLQCL